MKFRTDRIDRLAGSANPEALAKVALAAFDRLKSKPIDPEDGELRNALREVFPEYDAEMRDIEIETPIRRCTATPTEQTHVIWQCQ